MRWILVSSILISLILISSGSWGYKPLEQRVGVTFDNGLYISAEVADNRPAIQTGLMYREAIGQDEGMLFVFDREDKHIFWMKNVNFPLDMIWLDRSYRVVHIERNVPLCNSDPCTLYMPSRSAKYVLEMKAGLSSTNKINIGDAMTITG